MSTDPIAPTTVRSAVEIAAKATGLRPDQVQRAVEEYRAAVATVDSEPEWRSIVHMSGRGVGIAQYGSEGTRVTLQIDSWEERGTWKEERRYVLGEIAFEHFAEARAVELQATARPKPYEVQQQ